MGVGREETVPQELRLATTLLMLADSLCVYGVAQSPLSRTGIGLGASAREVSMQTPMLVHARPMDRLPWHIFVSLRTLHTHTSVLVEVNAADSSPRPSHLGDAAK
ncbi:hypothetical protein Ciccas_001618 [Cichlidogyrus casuarinus]|uniref:Secreted protein n=1 Tax=Cichlidogyrus casuarinus TaxID=1844966 RepID=A0ABD2QJK9_9PLAT